MKEERKPCFTCAHVKWFYGQSERAYYLNYFINFNRLYPTFDILAVLRRNFDILHSILPLKAVSPLFPTKAGSEQGKKRKRQESTREALNEDVKAGVAKRKKKTKVVEEVQREERDHEELITDAERTKSTVQNISDAKKGRKERASQATGKVLC